MQVISIKFDACPSNLNMAKSLGFDLSVNNMKSTFTDPATNREIAIFVDACHALHCMVHNCFQAKSVLYDSDDLPLKWSYLELLEKVQKDEGFVLGNKIKQNI